MATESVSAPTTIQAAPEAVFAVLADPSSHDGIDGTGWVPSSQSETKVTLTYGWSAVGPS